MPYTFLLIGVQQTKCRSCLIRQAHFRAVTLNMEIMMKNLLPGISLLCLLFFCGSVSADGPSLIVNNAEVRGVTINPVLACTGEGCSTIGVQLHDGANEVVVRCDGAAPSWDPVLGQFRNRCGEGTCIHVLGKVIRSAVFEVIATQYFVISPSYCGL